VVSVAALKILSIFQGKFRKSFGPEYSIFPKFCHNIQNFGKNCQFKILTKIKIPESTVYVISQLVFWGKGKEIAEERGNILPKVSPCFAERQNFGKIL